MGTRLLETRSHGQPGRGGRVRLHLLPHRLPQRAQRGAGPGLADRLSQFRRQLLPALFAVTTSSVSRSKDGEPFYAVVTLEDDEIFRCPFVFMSDVGTVGFDGEEVERLRTYLLKGGFLYVDDFWGDRAWAHWEQVMLEVLPEHVIQEVPSDHLLLNGLYQVHAVPQVPSIQYWYLNGAFGDIGARSRERRSALSRHLRRRRAGRWWS